MKKILIIVCLILLSLSNVYARDRMANFSYVISDETGRFYARCMPAKVSGSKGITKIFRVERDEDVLIDTYNWFNEERLMLKGNSRGEIAVMRLWQGIESEEAKESDKQVEFGFYINGRFLKSYSTKDILELGNDPSNPNQNLLVFGRGRNPNVNYEVLKPECGWLNYNDCFFVIKFPNGKKIRFDVNTGEVYAKPLPNSSSHPADENGKNVGEWKWFDEDKNLIASGTYKDGNPWDGSFFINGDIKVYKDGKIVLKQKSSLSEK